MTRAQPRSAAVGARQRMSSAPPSKMSRAAAGLSPRRPGRATGVRRRRGRGALALIGGLLIASALLRAGGGVDRLTAWAEEGEPTAPTEAADPTPDAAALLDALDAREARIDARERDLLLRMQALRVAEEEIGERLQALEAAESKLRATLDVARTAAETDITQLTDVYARMKPKQAAALFEEMDPGFAAGFLARMDPEPAAAIMAGLTSDKAYLISVVLAGRNADVPRPAPDQAQDTSGTTDPVASTPGPDG
ncbi:MgtE intracellular N domain protein [Roseivivax jejudonensis]|uniref:MgtE intracellular N domain protein n=1 Tax=Roseivivax jejudonensis TaxID=1529041 RepID=A0A1X6ZPX9_9RHOB|nr:hypothetical protein [Roseivivax jejudonensis]SLN57906.1 MgtE intracellular N domain protein [Roseivivax jejudonensis]